MNTLLSVIVDAVPMTDRLLKIADVDKSKRDFRRLWVATV